MIDFDPVTGMRLARAAADLGHYNLAKMLHASVISSLNRALFTESLPKTDRELVEAVAALEPGLRAAALDPGLLAAIQQAQAVIAADRLVLYDDAPPLYVCRVCGAVAWQAAPEHCPHCGAGALVYQLFPPAFYLEPEPAPLVLEKMSRTPAWLDNLLDGLSPAQTTRRIDGAAGAWSLAEAAGHLLDTQELIAQRVDLFLESISPNLSAKAMWQTIASARLSASEIAVNFQRSRHAMLTRLRSAPPAVWLRVGQHTEFGPVTLLQQCTYFAKHEHWHMAQMTQLRQALDHTGEEQ